jgi:phytoene dehydrogenase-like protein
MREVAAAAAVDSLIWQAPGCVAEPLDFALISRLRDVLRDEPATEAELRALSEQGDAWARTLQAQIDASERRLDELARRPGASLLDVAGELRRVERLRPQLAELRTLLGDLEERARRLRAEWLARQAGVAR